MILPLWHCCTYLWSGWCGIRCEYKKTWDVLGIRFCIKQVTGRSANQSSFLIIFMKRLAFPKVCHLFWLTEHTRLCSSILKSFEIHINYLSTYNNFIITQWSRLLKKYIYVSNLWFAVTFQSVPVSRAFAIGLKIEFWDSVGKILCWHLDLCFSKVILQSEQGSDWGCPPLLPPSICV